MPRNIPPVSTGALQGHVRHSSDGTAGRPKAYGGAVPGSSRRRLWRHRHQPALHRQDCFRAADRRCRPSRDNVLGVLSLIFWALIVVVTLKYVTVIMRADNRGEGGILALMALALRGRRHAATLRSLLLLGIVGAAPPLRRRHDHAGDLGAERHRRPGGRHAGVEALLVPITVAILVGLFPVQRPAPPGVGRFFGPVMLRLVHHARRPRASQILPTRRSCTALSPHHAPRASSPPGRHGFVVLGAVVLAVTGAEALYADMGHFGRRPIRSPGSAWCCPRCLLNYFGQGALLLATRRRVDEPVLSFWFPRAL